MEQPDHASMDISGGCSALALGTAQLGMRYGIANKTGQPDPGLAADIVAAAWRHGVRFFDTAQMYGVSEEVLGQALHGLGKNAEACIVTKLDANSDLREERAILASLVASIQRLKCSRLWGLLLHDEEKMDSWNDCVRNIFQHAKRDGLAARVGVSVYSPERALQALEINDLEIIQVPANVLDRRMVRVRFFERAHAMRKTVFIRSVYLQGLVLLPREASPGNIPHGAQAVDVLRRFCTEKGVSVQQFAVDHVRLAAPHARIILGAETAGQVRENCALFANPPGEAGLHQAWAEVWPKDIPELIDPRQWSPRG